MISWKSTDQISCSLHCYLFPCDTKRIFCLFCRQTGGCPPVPPPLVTGLWFGIHGSVLNWFQSYYHPVHSVLNVINTSLPSIFLHVVFLMALFSVLFFFSCILPHSALFISSLSLNHYLYADDSTQLFFSFHPRNLDSSVTHLQTALDLEDGCP